MTHTFSGWFTGISPVMAFDSVVPMGMNPRQQNSWLLHGGGMELMRRFYADMNLINFLAGSTSTQMGGWFRREIRGLEDLRGLRFRTPGIPGKVYARLGVTPKRQRDETRV